MVFQRIFLKNDICGKPEILKINFVSKLKKISNAKGSEVTKCKIK